MKRLLLLCVMLTGCAGAPSPDASAPWWQLEEQPFQLTDGRATTTEGQIQLIEQRQTDLDTDGQPEAIAVLVVNGGGSGSFYYVAASRWQDGQWQPAGANFVGDRIAYQGLTVYPNDHLDAGSVSIAFKVHGQDQPFSEPPRFELARQYRLVDGRLQLQAPY